MGIHIDVLSLNLGSSLSREVKTGMGAEIVNDNVLAKDVRLAHVCVRAQGALSEVTLFSHLLIGTELHGGCTTFHFFVHHLVLRVAWLS